MPWKQVPMHEQRLVLVHLVRSLLYPVSKAAAQCGVSRKTAYKWLARFDENPQAPLLDHSRRPHRSPRRCANDLEQLAVAVRRRFGWGPRKIRAYLFNNSLYPRPLPSVRTFGSILHRHGLVPAPTPPTPPLQHFERSAPNELWQMDHKGPVEVERQKVMPLTILDDHSRYCLAFEPCLDLTMATAWAILWQVLGEVGLPQSLLCDNAFNTRSTGPGLSWFDSQLIRLHIRPIHGRPYHPQTQGKVESFHGSACRELIDFDARRDKLELFRLDCQRHRLTHNTLRPHEALGDLPPISRWRPSPRQRPQNLPEVEYPAGALLRKVGQVGEVRYRGCRILVGRGISGQLVRVEEREKEVALFYAWKQLRVIAYDQLPHGHDKML
jgi:transposase InsO family protein